MATPDGTDSEASDFFVQIERVRKEVQTHFQDLIECFKAREIELLEELERLATEHRERTREQDGMRKELETTRRLIEDNIHYSDLRPLQQDVIAKIEDKLRHMQLKIQNRKVECLWSEDYVQQIQEIGKLRVTEGVNALNSTIDYKKKLRPIVTVANKGDGEGDLDFPWGVAVDYLTSYIYVSDHSNHRVQVFSQDGKFHRTIGNENGAGKMQRPLGICLFDGKLYVSQFSGHCVLVYKLDGSFVCQVGCPGKGEGQLNNPYNLAINEENGDVYVCDGGNNRIQVFSQDHAFKLLLWQNTFRRPVDIKLAHQCVFVLDESDPCLHIFNSNHAPMKNIITRGSRNQVSCSYFFCLDAEMNIYLTDFSAGFVYVFDVEGQLIHQFGGLHQPLGIALDLNGRIILVNNKQEECLQMW